MDCNVDVDRLRHRWVHRRAKSPIRDEQILLHLSDGLTRPSRAQPSRAGDVYGLLLASSQFAIQLSNLRLLECRDGRLTSGVRHANTTWLTCFQLHKQQQQQPFYGPLSGTTWVSRYQKKHSPTHHPDHHPIFISFFHLPRSIASSLFKLRAWQSLCTTSFHVLFGLPLGLEPSTSYSIHFFTQSVSSFCSTWPYHRNQFCCSINIISPILVFLSTPYLKLCLLP